MFEEYLRSNFHTPYGAVVGNEAADADSIVSALITAYVLSKKHGNLYVPIVQCDREDMMMKREVRALFEWAWNFSDLPAPSVENCLRFNEESTDLLKPGVVKKWVLTDHNSPTGIFKDISPIELVIDHHAILDGDIGERRIVELVGSACTLVGKEFWEFLCPVTMRLLLGVIIIDTFRNGKETAADMEIRTRLENQLKIDQTEKLGHLLVGLRDDSDFWANLPHSLRLKSDYKEIKKIGISTIRQNMDVFIKGHGLIAIEEFADKKNLKIMIVLAAEYNRRVLLAFSHDVDILQDLRCQLLKSSLGVFEVVDFGSIGDHFIVLGVEMKSTRKQVLPFMHTFINSYST